MLLEEFWCVKHWNVYIFVRNHMLLLRSYLLKLHKLSWNLEGFPNLLTILYVIVLIIRKMSEEINLIFTTLITALLFSLAVNVSRSQHLYNSLVNMDIQKDELSQAVQERLLLAPTSFCHSNKERGGPSHLIFMTSDLMRQQPFSSEEGTAKSKLCPLPPSSRSAFDLYRRQKCHEATSWQVCLAPQCFKNKKYWT